MDVVFVVDGLDHGREAVGCAGRARDPHQGQPRGTRPVPTFADPRARATMVDALPALPAARPSRRSEKRRHVRSGSQGSVVLTVDGGQCCSPPLDPPARVARGIGLRNRFCHVA